MLKRAVFTMVILLVGGLIVQGVEELAELHVTTITLDPPSSITQGVDIEIRARVMNTGQRSASPVNVGLFYRPMNGSSSWVLAESIDGATLTPSQEDYLEITFSLNTEALELGTYQIRIVADPLNQITEVDELNNELLTSFLLIASSLGLPDLQPVSLAYTRTNPESADDLLPWNVTTTVENPTPSQAGAFTVVFLLNGVEFDRQFLFALPAGGAVDVVGEFDPFILGLAPGTYDISVAVDPDEQVLEQDEANNSIAGALTLLSPDLYPISLSFDKSVLHLDEEMRVTTQIANGGEGTAKNVDVGFYIDHVRFAVIQIPLLGRGLTTSIEATLSPDIVGLLDAPETYEIEIVVDPNQVLPELDEANNRMSRSMTILEPGIRQPELHPESFELGPASPVELGRTDTITLTTVVRNTGRAIAEDFSATFYYRVKGGLRWEEIPCSGESSCSSLDLASGMQTKLVSILPVILLQPGIYEVRVLVDSDSMVDELDESNNELITSLTLLAARLPDLAFSYMQGIRIEPSTQVHRGQTIRFTPTITNTGDLDAGEFLVRFSYQNVSDAASAAQTGQQVEFRTAYFSPDSSMQVRSLAIGETAEIPVLLETRDLAPGQYLIQMEIDPAGGSSTTGQVFERNENNNIISSQVAVLGPDLAALDLYTVPGGVVDQSQINSLDVVSTIINSGVAPAGEFTVKFQLLSIDDTGTVPIRIHSCGESADCGTPEFFGEVTLPGIGTLVPEQVRCSLDLSSVDLEPGQYVIRVLVDCQGGIGLDGMCLGQIAEHNELNNLLEVPVVISGRRAVDLSVADLAMTSDEDAISVEFVATIANTGVKSADSFSAVLRLFGTRADCVDSNPRTCSVLLYEQVIQVPGLGGHATHDVVWTVDLPTHADLANLTDIYVAQVDVDCDRIVDDVCQGHIEELDESNNMLEIPVVISGWRAVDLSVADLFITSEADTNLVTFSATVANIGVKSANGFDVALHLFGRLADCADSDALACEVPVFEQIVQIPGLDSSATYDVVWVVDMATVDSLFDLTDTYVAQVTADCDAIVNDSCQGHIEESDETNNRIRSEMQVGTEVLLPVGEGANLTIQSFHALETSGTPSTSQIWTTIINEGTEDVGEFFVVFYYLDDSDQRVDLPIARVRGLAAGADTAVLRQFDTSQLSRGYHVAGIVVDINNNVLETNEGDNSRETDLSIR
jgi:subtilase family serine protease